MRRAAAVVALVVVFASGCSTTGGQEDGTVGGSTVYVFTRIVDGREVPCIAWYKAMSCDWGRP